MGQQICFTNDSTTSHLPGELNRMTYVWNISGTPAYNNFNAASVSGSQLPACMSFSQPGTYTVQLVGTNDYQGDASFMRSANYSVNFTRLRLAEHRHQPFVAGVRSRQHELQRRWHEHHQQLHLELLQHGHQRAGRHAHRTERETSFSPTPALIARWSWLRPAGHDDFAGGIHAPEHQPDLRGPSPHRSTAAWLRCTSASPTRASAARLRRGHGTLATARR
ncbi:MAG: PKD domain-containing protein [Anaerolineae bacterium]